MPFINDKMEYLAKQRAKREQEEKLQTKEAEETVPQTLVQTRFKFDVQETVKRLRERIHGQEQAIKAIENMLKVVKADIADPEKPLYVGLFMGPTGVGKTEMVRLLAEAIHGNRNSFCRVDMNTLSLDHYAAALTGAPPGYVGSKEGATILDKEKIEGSFSKPGIILFDEIEKASEQVMQTLLNIFDNGIMTITSGQDTINFRNAIIVMTSNLGAKEMYDSANNRLSFLLQKLAYCINPSHWGKRNESILGKIIEEKLHRTFKPEFLNRIDEIITFNWLEKDTIREIIETFSLQLAKRLEKYNCELRLENSAVELLVENGFDKRYGARALKRAFRQHIEVPLAELVMEQGHRDQRVVYVADSPDRKRVVIAKL
ncbi:AAA family ATPase [Brevibacillus massiliensis]|jgi:ATP-dependent Clp protease ATP-binding subunit ClpA|uniref:AAA family ATPase n=1 Tax=Brevibacillus massiliensis TaxID=1118054 RepID=UPI0002FF4E39|nr:AAA family ATPase [Brevibacillus massiliensis]